MIPLALLTLREDFAPTWEAVASAIRTSYYARQTRHDEMERRLAEAAPRAKAAPNRQAFESVVNAMIVGFGDSHFEFLSDEDQGYYSMDGLLKGDKAASMPQIGAWFAHGSDGYTVQMVLEGSAAASAGLRVGDLVTRIDDKPFSPVAALAEKVGHQATLTVRRNGVENTAPVAVTRTTVPTMFLDATLASRRTVERNGKRIGVMHLWTQGDPHSLEALKDALDAAKDDDGFVLDLRSGFGGYPKPYEDALKGYRKPLAVVIDRGSRSAKEVLSYDLQRAHRATLVGERTAGAVLGTFPRRLNDWAYIEIPIVDYAVGGVRLEKRGVEPDVPVPAGIDPVERAVEVLTATRV